MLNNILEISKRASKGGRVPIKIALLKIHDVPTETNRNGLHWKEEYVLNAIDSVKMMPICASFCDETKSVPLDHGLTGEYVDENGVHEPLFENSDTVGCFEGAEITNVTIEGKEVKVLAANGYLFNQRYPAFVKWVRENHATNGVDTSVEIMGLPSNSNKIIYEEDNPTDKFRTPKTFTFSASCVLSVQPADENAIVLEVAQNKKTIKEETKMEFNMDEIKSVIKTTMTELNSREDEFSAKIQELNSKLEDKDSVIAQKDSEICERDKKISELNATVEQVQKALDDLKKEHQSYYAEREVLEKELGELKAKARLAELNSALEPFSDEEKKFAEVEINSFNETPMDGDIDAIVSKIFAGIGKESKKASEEARISEQNSTNESVVEDIFSEMCTETHIEEEEDLNIF